MEAGRRMTRLIDEILESAQVGATLRMAPVQLGAVADAVRQDVAPLLAAGAEILVDPLPTVIGDEQQLYSVVLNLVSNAMKFTRSGVPARVRISAERGEERWRVLVTDQGLGVPSTGVGRLFMPFVRGDTDAPGNGVGLASAKRIVEMHGGRIGLDPARSGTGTTAWFEIPD
jgi:signal transduction histidine kinase